MKKYLAIILFLNGNRGISVINELLAYDYNIKAVVTEKKNTLTLLDNICKHKNIKHISTENPNKDKEILNLDSDINIIAGYSIIFKKKLLDKPKFGTINLHAGKLPQYRGGSPLNWQIINGEKKVYCTIIQAVEGIDEGDILAEKSINVKTDDTILDVHEKVNRTFPKLTLSVLKKISSNQIIPKKQNDNQAVYWHQRNDRDGRIFWDTMSSEKVYNFVRALTFPYPGAYSFYDNKKIRIWDVQLTSKVIKGVPGRIIWLEGAGPYVICKDNALRILKYTADENLVLKHGFYLI